MNRPRTLGELSASGYQPRSVKDEMRSNLLGRLRSGEGLFPGIVGYDETVIPQVINAILSRHDMLFLGLRGQAKTRMLRLLPELLDEYRPVVDGVDLPDDPLQPVFRQTRELISAQGDATPLRWVHRSERYQEKLATPDVTIADLLGDIDLIKHAAGRHLSDEAIIHFGLIPRSNLGIFAINELPDLAPRIQVGLFNVLEERDVQIRGFPIRLPLDVCMVFSANPEDYTNRGRIVTPLKDRIGSVIRTHYPSDPADSRRITAENAWLDRNGKAPSVCVPKWMAETVEEFVRLARTSPHVNQQSGVSVRASIASLETLVSNAERRATLAGASKTCARVSDLAYLAASCRGKIELLLAEDDQSEEKLIRALLGEASKGVAGQYVKLDELEPVVQQFQGGKANLEVGDEVPDEALASAVGKLRALAPAAEALCSAGGLDPADPAALASAGEFLLETLYVNNRLSKYAYRKSTFYKR